MIRDVDESGFQQQVVDRSREVPVVVDFWAEWCAPCRFLTPALEAAATARSGRLDLAKVDVDRAPNLAARFGIQGIPAVKAFRDGEVVSEFTGALPPPAVERFFDALVPSEADELAAGDDEAGLRRALELDPRQRDAAVKLARLLLARGEHDEALEIVERFPGDFTAAGLAARARLARAGHDQDGAWTAWDRGDHAAALEALQDALAAAEGEDRDLVRQAIVGVLADLDPASALAREHRRRLSAALL